MLIRRVRRVIGERARAVHPDLQPASYLILDDVAQGEPGAGLGDRRSSSTSTRARSAARSSTSSSWACSTASRTPPTRAPRCSRSPTRRAPGWPTSPSTGSKQLGERLGGLDRRRPVAFVAELGRYNAALNVD